MKILTVAVLSAILFSQGCCTAEKHAAKNVEDTQNLILPEYVRYVEVDTTLKAAQKEDKLKLVESLKKLTSVLRKSLGD